MVNTGSNRYMQTNETPDGKQLTLCANNIYSIEYCAAYVEKADEYVLKSDSDKLKQDNDEMKAKLAALESKLNQISLSNYYTKSECDNQYTVKPPTIEVLEERHYRKDSDGHDKIVSHSEEHFIMHGLTPNGYSFNLNQIINEGEVIRLSSGDYIFFNQSDDGQYLVCNTFLQNIYYCAAYIDKALSYINA